MPQRHGEAKMKNKILIGLFAFFLISIVAFAGITYAYKGDANVKGPNYTEDVHEQMEAAMDAGDYDAWVQIRQDNNLPMTGRMFQTVNKDNFGKYVQMHNAMESGDTETADAIRAELGLGLGMQRQGTGQGLGSGNRQGAGQKMGSGQGLGTNAGTHNCGSCPLNN
jgi:hypothetical protein